MYALLCYHQPESESCSIPHSRPDQHPEWFAGNPSPGVDITEDEERAEVRRTTVVEHSDVLPNVAFKTAEGKIVLIVANDSWSRNHVKVQYNGRFANLPLAPGLYAYDIQA